MIRCLETNKVCPNTNKKCKECVFDDCKKAIKAVEEDMKEKEKNKIARLQTNLAVEYKDCENCTIRETLNLDKQKLYCPYMIRERCVLK